MAILLVAIVSRLDAGKVRWRGEGRPNLVGDADIASVALDASDRERVADRLRWLLFNGLELQRNWRAPLEPSIARELGERLGDGTRACQTAERVRDRQRPVAQLLHPLLERRPQLVGRRAAIRSLRSET